MTPFFRCFCYQIWGFNRDCRTWVVGWRMLYLDLLIGVTSHTTHGDWFADGSADQGSIPAVASRGGQAQHFASDCDYAVATKPFLRCSATLARIHAGFFCYDEACFIGADDDCEIDT